jgi:voltage-gated potassium channel Kch
MTTAPLAALPPNERRRLIARGLLRALTWSTVLTAVYFLAPIEHLDRVPVWASLVVALLLLLVVTAWQIRAIVDSAHPGIRAIEALAVTVPSFILLFAISYLLMARDDPTNFSDDGLDHVDSLYFTVTTFSTVGFGDITATSQTARLLVTTQMILGLIVLGLGIRVILRAVERGADRPARAPSDGP